MYYASTHIRTPKHKMPCTVVTIDGETLEGSLFTSGDQRIKDLLNGESEFIPFEFMSGEISLLNRRAIARVMPREAVVRSLAERSSDELAAR